MTQTKELWTTYDAAAAAAALANVASRIADERVAAAHAAWMSDRLRKHAATAGDYAAAVAAADAAADAAFAADLQVAAAHAVWLEACAAARTRSPKKLSGLE